jgi:hypothetical protein
MAPAGSRAAPRRRWQVRLHAGALAAQRRRLPPPRGRVPARACARARPPPQSTATRAASTRCSVRPAQRSVAASQFWQGKFCAHHFWEGGSILRCSPSALDGAAMEALLADGAEPTGGAEPLLAALCAFPPADAAGAGAGVHADEEDGKEEQLLAHADVAAGRAAAAAAATAAAGGAGGDATDEDDDDDECEAAAAAGAAPAAATQVAQRTLRCTVRWRTAPALLAARACARDRAASRVDAATHACRVSSSQEPGCAVTFRHATQRAIHVRRAHTNERPFKCKQARTRPKASICAPCCRVLVRAKHSRTAQC